MVGIGNPESIAVLAGLFRAHRERLGFSQSEAAGLIGVSVASLDSYERGRRFPKPQQLDALFTHYSLTDEEQIGLLRTLSDIRSKSYRWVAALLQTNPGHTLLRETLRAYATLGAGQSAREARADVPVPRRVFPKRIGG